MSTDLSSRGRKSLGWVLTGTYLGGAGMALTLAGRDTTIVDIATGACLAVGIVSYGRGITGSWRRTVTSLWPIALVVVLALGFRLACNS